jgi:hypothetical protein
MCDEMRRLQHRNARLEAKAAEPIDDGGPAFPQDCGPRAFPGMSLRDYFAAAAMTGLLASGEFLAERLLENPDLTMGSLAYKAADENLAARKGAA